MDFIRIFQHGDVGLDIVLINKKHLVSIASYIEYDKSEFSCPQNICLNFTTTNKNISLFYEISRLPFKRDDDIRDFQVFCEEWILRIINGDSSNNIINLDEISKSYFGENK